MNRALNQISRSPFTRKIEGRKLPRWFTQATFTMYNGRTDPVEHVSHFNQRMVVHSENKTLMCKVFPSSLGSVAILTSLSTMKRMVAIDADQRLLLVSLSRMMRIITMSTKTEAHLPKTWEMMR